MHINNGKSVFDVHFPLIHTDIILGIMIKEIMEFCWFPRDWKEKIDS